MGAMAWRMFSPVLGFINGCIRFIFGIAFWSALIFFTVFLVRYRINFPAWFIGWKKRGIYSAYTLRRFCVFKLSGLEIRYKYYDFFRWVLIDLLNRYRRKGEFQEYGITFYVARQGGGKTSSMVYYLERMRQAYPDCVIVTNFKYEHGDYLMKDWGDFFNVRNGTAGVIFALDEIHSEFSTESSRNFPESLLSEISQQRKQRVKIIASAQFFTRVAKPLREQAFSVVTCECWMKRLVKCREYDGLMYSSMVENPIAIRKKLRPMRKWSYVLSDSLRGCFDTYEKIERMKKSAFIPRCEREG